MFERTFKLFAKCLKVCLNIWLSMLECFGICLKVWLNVRKVFKNIWLNIPDCHNIFVECVAIFCKNWFKHLNGFSGMLEIGSNVWVTAKDSKCFELFQTSSQTVRSFLKHVWPKREMFENIMGCAVAGARVRSLLLAPPLRALLLKFSGMWPAP